MKIQYRALWYLIMTAVEDERVQKLGIVLLTYLLDDFSGGFDYELLRNGVRLVQALPYRYPAHYMMIRDQLWNQVLDVWDHIVYPLLRVRQRAVRGSYQECLYLLLCLGISPHAIPVDDNGVMKLKAVEKWISNRRVIEENCAAHRSRPASSIGNRK